MNGQKLGQCEVGLYKPMNFAKGVNKLNKTVCYDQGYSVWCSHCPCIFSCLTPILPFSCLFLPLAHTVEAAAKHQALVWS